MPQVKPVRGAMLAIASLVASACWLLGAGATDAFAWSPPAPIASAVAKTTNVPITMSDGTVLYADVVRPADSSGNPLPGRYPVLLTQTPYNKNSPSLNFEDDYLVEHGYVQVIVDVRGTGASQGTWESFGPREQLDGYELAVWTRSQPWSDGLTGLHGTSYGAINQFQTAELQPPGVKASFPIVPMSDAYRDVTFGGGEVNTGFIPLWLGLVTATGMLPPTYTTGDPATAANVLVAHSGGALSFQASQVVDSSTGGNAAYDGPFYRARSPIEAIAKDRIPTFVVGGWFDLFQRGEPLLYQALHRQGVPTRLLMGPWYHITAGGGLPAGGVATLDQLELRWMNHYVKGLPDPGLDNKPGAADTIAPVTYYENAAGKWLTDDGWYGSDVSFHALHLSGPAAPGQAGSLKPTAPSAQQSPDTLLFVPTSGGCSRSTVQWTAGAGAGTPCESDNRVNDATGLTYDMPVTQTMHLLGPMTAKLFLGSSGGQDTMVTARVEDVAPDGSSTQISAGWQVLSLRALDASRTVYANGLMAQPYHPFTQASVLPMPADGSPVEVDVEIYPGGWALLPGHTLRLALQQADTPHLTASTPLTVASAGARLSIYHDAAHDSQLILPLRDRVTALATPATNKRHHKQSRAGKRSSKKRKARSPSSRPRRNAGFTG